MQLDIFRSIGGTLVGRASPKIATFRANEHLLVHLRVKRFGSNVSDVGLIDSPKPFVSLPSIFPRSAAGSS